jgi:hypothetical protein
MLQKRQSTTTEYDWVLLVHLLPSRPTNLRVRIWRKLQKLGAVAIKNSVYVLPASEKTNEDFQWLKQEIESAGGEAAVFRAGSVDGTTDEEIVKAFRDARNAEYRAIAAEFDGLTGRIREQSRAKHLSPGRLAAHETEIDRLHAELERITSNDYFNADARTDAVTAYERCQKTLRLSQTPAKQSRLQNPRSNSLSIADFQRRRWMTRRNIHIDRLASAWLIKQFVDKHPRFYFVADGETVDNAIPFDMFGAEFAHQGEDCTFETLLKRFGLDGIKGLRELGEIVHDIDLKDDKFHRLEAAGLNAIINGLSGNLRNDRKLLQQAAVIFDALFALLDKQTVTGENKAKAKRSTKKTREKSR